MGLNSGVSGSEFLRIFVTSLMATGLPCVLLGGVVGMGIAFGVSLAVTPVVMAVTSKIGKAAGCLHGGINKPYDPKELLIPELTQAQFALGQKRFDDALVSVNATLAKDNDLTEALWLKAEILWRGFEDQKEAISVLRKLLAVTKHGAPHYRWALLMLDELTAVKKEGVDAN